MRGILYALAIMMLIGPATAAERRWQQWGNRPGEIYGFGTSKCKTNSCLYKHPNGYWKHPLTVPCGVGRGHRCPH